MIQVEGILLCWAVWAGIVGMRNGSGTWDLLVAVALVARSLVGVGDIEEGELHFVLDCS